MVQRTRTNRKVSSWTDEEIRGLINNFIEREGRIPNTKDLKAPEMPPKRIFMPIYGVTAGEWLSANYGPSVLSYDERKKKYAEDFIEEYKKLRPRTSDEYNERKRSDLPRWQVLMKYYNLTCWTKVLEQFGLPRYINEPKPQPKSVEFQVEIVWH